MRTAENPKKASCSGPVSLATRILVLAAAIGLLIVPRLCHAFGEDEHGKFAALRDSVTAELLSSFEPEELRMMGHAGAAGQLKDWSPAAIAEEVRFCREALKNLNSAPASLPSDVLDRAILVAHLTYLIHYFGVYHGELGNLELSAYPYSVMQYEMMQFDSGRIDFASAQNRFGAIEGILRSVPAYLNQQEANLIAGTRMRAPDSQMLQTLIDRIGSDSDGDSIRGGLRALQQRIEEPQLQGTLPVYQRKALAALLQRADKAYERHAAFLTGKLRPLARNSWALGEKEYRTRLALIYGYGGSLEELVRPAEQEVARIRKEMIELAHQLRPDLPQTDDVHLVVLRALRDRHPVAKSELLSEYVEIQKRIDSQLTTKLGLPTDAAVYKLAPLGVPVSLATNWPAPLLSEGAALVLVEASPTNNPTVDIPWIAAHEGSPGHGLQSRFFHQSFSSQVAPLCRFLNVPDEVGYVRGNWSAMPNIEGWAFFAERLLLSLIHI